jgi:pimeloyl-ACP methyl ester carboxylesterase
MASSSSPTPGILYVTMQPKPHLSLDQFHDWYNNEHGPNRNRLPCVENGFRYRATDLENVGGTGSDSMPEYLACYDITDMDDLNREPYISLRTDAVKSQREKDTMAEIEVDRKLYDLVGDNVNQDDFIRIEDMSNFNKVAEGNVLVSVLAIVPAGEKTSLDSQYEKVYIPQVKKIPGWKRTRQYVTSGIEPREDGKIEYLAVHEFAPQTGLTQTEVLTKEWPAIGKTRAYNLYYIFSAAERHLYKAATWNHPNGLTKITSKNASAVIDSFITTPDGIRIPYRLEGNPDPEAPLIVLSNSILVTLEIWNSFIEAFFSKPDNKKYRILRYLTRGRLADCGSKAITVDVLASDIITLLDTLRVPQAAAVIGVSLGGATALNVALKYPSRVAAFIACDTSSKSPAGNSKAWGDRIAMAEKEGAQTSSGEKVVGAELAEVTVRRWFVKESYDGGAMEAEAARVKEMVASNSLEGFKKSVEALFEYDMKNEMKGYAGKGAFLVGSGDGVLPGTMKEMAQNLGSDGGEYFVVEGAGHLPMVEKGQEVAEIVTKFLAS